MPKLVTIGDSLTQGFRSGAVADTGWAWPQMVALALTGSRMPAPDFQGGGGLPLNLERLVRELEAAVGTTVDWWDVLTGLGKTKSLLDRTEDYWERGDGTKPAEGPPLHHNLAVWGFEVLDAYTVSDAACERVIPPPTDNAWLKDEVPEHPMYRTARRTLNPTADPALRELSQVDAARAIAEREGPIENLVVLLGANNVLGTCTQLDVRYSQSSDLYKLPHQRNGTIWAPEHFERVVGELFARLARLQADGLVERVFVGNVPTVTVPPLTRGVSPVEVPGEKDGRDRDGLYQFYTSFWIWDDDFAADPHRFPHLTREEVRNIEAIVGEYGRLVGALAAAEGWPVIDVRGLVEGMAFRRSDGRPKRRLPSGLVEALADNPATAFRVWPDADDGSQQVLLDSRYLQVPGEAQRRALQGRPFSEWQQAFQGGLFSLDGIHPTTIGYGLLAHAVLEALAAAGVPDADPAELDWDAIVAADELVTDPPALLSDLRRLLGALATASPLEKVVRLLSGAASQPLAT